MPSTGCCLCSKELRPANSERGVDLLGRQRLVDVGHQPRRGCASDRSVELRAPRKKSIAITRAVPLLAAQLPLGSVSSLGPESARQVRDCFGEDDLEFADSNAADLGRTAAVAADQVPPSLAIADLSWKFSARPHPPHSW